MAGHPTLQAEGAIAAVTTGNLTVTIPAHVANDILVVTSVAWLPNTTPGNPTNPTTPTDWNLGGSLLDQTGLKGHTAFYWRRATAAGMTFVQTRPGGWDTGTDGIWAGRAYVIRGCITSGTPYDDIQNAFNNPADPRFPAVTVSGSERTVIQFWVAPDNLAASAAPSGWTAGTALTSATGTDSGFQTFRKENISSSTTNDVTTEVDPLQGIGYHIGASFRPPPPPFTPPLPFMKTQAIHRASVW